MQHTLFVKFAADLEWFDITEFRQDFANSAYATLLPFFHLVCHSVLTVNPVQNLWAGLHPLSSVYIRIVESKELFATPISTPTSPFKFYGSDSTYLKSSIPSPDSTLKHTTPAIPISHFKLHVGLIQCPESPKTITTPIPTPPNLYLNPRLSIYNDTLSLFPPR